jgi:hypothetical protein
MGVRVLCVVNSVGPVSGDWVTPYLDPHEDPDNHAPILVITLTALDNSFHSYAVRVDMPPLSNQMLAVALAAINTGNQVLAAIDWPQPIVGKDQDGNTLYGPAYCYSLWLNAS